MTTVSSQSSLDSKIYSICDIMRRSNAASALQYIPELTWILFLRILDDSEYLLLSPHRGIFEEPADLTL